MKMYAAKFTKFSCWVLEMAHIWFSAFDDKEITTRREELSKMKD